MLIDYYETDRLVLRYIKPTDVNDIYNNWASDYEVTKYLTWNHHETIETTKMILGFWMDDYNNKTNMYRYGIALKSNPDELIGMIDMVNPGEDIPHIGYVLSRNYWNNGYMTEACKKMIEILFEDFDKVMIEADVDNIGSNRVIEKCGFNFIGTETKTCSSFKPVTVTTNWYEIKK